MILVAGWALSLAWSSQDAERALVLGGIVALSVQLCAFALARSMGPARMFAGWAVGAGVSMATLIVFGIVAQSQGLPMEPALLGVASYLFLTELVEPFFLRA